MHRLSLLALCLACASAPSGSPDAGVLPAAGPAILDAGAAVTSPAVLHLVNRWGCRRTRAQLGLGGPWAAGVFHPAIACGESCAGRYGLPDTLQGQRVRWELAPGSSPHSRGALRLLETLLTSPGDPLLANGQVEHRGSDALAEQDLALLHCGQTPAYTWLANRLATALGGRAAIVSHREGQTLATDDTLVAAICEPCEWNLTVHRTVEPTSPWDSGRRRHRLNHQGATWELDLSPEWVGAGAVVSVSPVGEPGRGSAPMNLTVVAGSDGGDGDDGDGNGGDEEDGEDGTGDGEDDNGDSGDGGDDLCKDAFEGLEKALSRAKLVCLGGTAEP